MCLFFFTEKLQPIDVPEFTGNSVLELLLGDIGSTAMTFTILFKTSKPNGMFKFLTNEFPVNGIVVEDGGEEV